MSTPESLAEAFARGLMGALLAGGKSPKEPKPTVVKQDDVRAAVAAEVLRIINEEGPPPTAPQMDLFTSNIENHEGDEMGEMIARRVAETRERVERENSDEPPQGWYRPDDPQPSPWTAPRQP